MYGLALYLFSGEIFGIVKHMFCMCYDKKWHTKWHISAFFHKKRTHAIA